jgi:DNA-binding MarR family transcriptional regulator
VNGGDSGPPLEGDRAPSSLGFLLSQMGIYASQKFAERIGALDLHPGQFRVLNVVDAAEGESQHAIAAATEVPASRMVALVDELEGRGLVERRPHATDRRVRSLYLTSKGRNLLERGREIASEHEAALTKGMTAGDRAKLVELLRKLASEQGIGSSVHPGLSGRAARRAD